jgi:hypothetical protein
VNSGDVKAFCWWGLKITTKFSTVGALPYFKPDKPGMQVRSVPGVPTILSNKFWILTMIN